MKANLENEKSADKLPVYDVIICGAGPVGLFLACELALAKCSVLILEKATTPASSLKQLPFGIRGLSAPSIEALFRRGLLDKLEIHKRIKNPHQNVKKGAQRLGGHFAGIPFQISNVDTSKWHYRLPSSTATQLITEMEELETVMTRRAKELNIDIKYGHAVTDIQQSDNEVTVQAGSQHFTGKWLVGCDGGRSTVRKKSGIDFVGTEPEFTGYSILVELAGEKELLPGRIVTTRGMYMHSQPGYILIQDFDGGEFHTSKKQITHQHMQEVLRRVSNTQVTIKTLKLATTWTDRARQAAAYRNKRVFLAGDAAHIQSPLGGQGLNLGLGDAMNLGWKLAATIHGKATSGLLDSYYSERYPIGEQVLNWSRAQVALMKPDPGARALNAILRTVMDTVDGATYFAERVWGVSLHYDFGQAHTHPMVGYSVPNFAFDGEVTLGDLMHQGQWMLLDFDRIDSLHALANKFTGQINYVSKTAKQPIGLHAILVRPDGVVVWASAGPTNTGEVMKVLSCWII